MKTRDERVDASESFDTGVDEMHTGGLFRQVAGHGQYLCPGSLHLSGRVAQCVLVPGSHDDAGALAGQHQRGCLADATRGAGDDRYLTAETEVHLSITRTTRTIVANPSGPHDRPGDQMRSPTGRQPVGSGIWLAPDIMISTTSTSRAVMEPLQSVSRNTSSPIAAPMFG